MRCSWKRKPNSWFLGVFLRTTSSRIYRCNQYPLFDTLCKWIYNIIWLKPLYDMYAVSIRVNRTSYGTCLSPSCCQLWTPYKNKRPFSLRIEWLSVPSSLLCVFKNNPRHAKSSSHTVDGSELPRPTTWHGAKTLVNNGISTTNLNWWVCRISGCHQRYLLRFGVFSYILVTSNYQTSGWWQLDALRSVDPQSWSW